MTQKKQTRFIASYEDADKLVAAATARGCPPDGNYLDYVEANDHRSGKSFDTLEAATAWLVSQINARKTVFGCGDVVETELVERPCRYCICNGWRRLGRTVVDDTGAVETHPCDDDCVD